MSTAGFHEEWFCDASQEVLARLARSTDGLEGRVVEIGSWEGRSTVALANAVHPDIVHAVDTWEGSPGEISADLAAQRDIYATWQANIETLTKGNVEPHRRDWRDFFAWNPGPCRFVFIDAEHTYQEVRDNIDAALPMMVPGGIICGDDAHHPPIQEAVYETFPNAKREATLWWARIPEKNPTLATEYRRLCAEPSDIYLHLPRMVALVEELDASHVIELGTRSGVSTVAWLHALNGRGRLTSIDLDPAPAIGDHEHWSFIQGDDLDPATTRALEPAEIVFVDTSHLYEQTLAELYVYRWLVKPGGVIVLHDTQLERPEGAPARPRFPVRTAIEEFTIAENFRWIEFPECFGLGVIEVR